MRGALFILDNTGRAKIIYFALFVCQINPALDRVRLTKTTTLLGAD